MFVRSYYVFARCYSTKNSLTFSEHSFGLSFNSFFKPRFLEIINAARKEVMELSVFSEGDGSKIVIMCVSRL